MMKEPKECTVSFLAKLADNSPSTVIRIAAGPSLQHPSLISRTFFSHGMCEVVCCNRSCIGVSLCQAFTLGNIYTAC